MTLRELKERVDKTLLELRDEADIEVVIPNGKFSIGRISTTKVLSADRGFDWESELFIINPEVNMVEDDK